MKKHYLIIIFLLFYFAITSYKFITRPTPFYDWDESIYAQVGQEMVQHRSIVPLWQGKFWLDKPPLVPLAYGIVASIFPFAPELSTRLFTLFLSIILFSFIYIFYFKICKNEYISFLTVVISAFTSIFLQRTQVLNVDIFLFLGWMGYILFFDYFWISFLFLAIGVMSKSLLGFYPAFIMLIFFLIQLATKKLSLFKCKKNILQICIQSTILIFWYIGMFLFFSFPFIQAHFFDSHLKRVTASIESHFGKRTFYIDLLIEQLRPFIFASIIGIILLVKKFIQKKDLYIFILATFFIPWFIFLNLTKTKIDWYLYPVIPQFAFISFLILQVIYKQKLISFIITICIALSIIYLQFNNNSFINSKYSQYDQQYSLAMYAKDNCTELVVLVDKDSRTTHDTLKNMNLLINTSEWWGNHPALVYYSKQKVQFEYNINTFKSLLQAKTKGFCYVVNKEDLDSFATSSIQINKIIDQIYIIN